MIFSGKDFSFELGKKTYVMGVLNVTEDSFFDGGMYNSPEKAISYTKRMLEDGADIIDIGANSSRPGHTVLSEKDELEIIKQYLPLLKNETNALISVDTFYPKVTEYALENGASIVNDISGVFNPEMAELVKTYSCGWIIMHTGGGNSSTVVDYEKGVSYAVLEFFMETLKKCEEFGVSKNQLCFDMGIGFGKSHKDNLELIKNIKDIKIKDVALLTALSSKRVVANSTKAQKEDLIYGTISANSLAIQGGTDIIRVHNVRENILAAKMCDAVVRG